MTTLPVGTWTVSIERGAACLYEVRVTSRAMNCMVVTELTHVAAEAIGGIASIAKQVIWRGIEATHRGVP